MIDVIILGKEKDNQRNERAHWQDCSWSMWVTGKDCFRDSNGTNFNILWDLKSVNNSRPSLPTLFIFQVLLCIVSIVDDTKLITKVCCEAFLEFDVMCLPLYLCHGASN